MKNVSFYLTTVISLLLLQSCSSMFESEQFGVKESVWNTMSPEERQLTIAGYNERKKEEAQLLMKEQEAEARNAPFKMLLNALSSSEDHHSDFTGAIKISSIDSGTINLNNGVRFEVCPFIGNDVKHWMPGNRIRVNKGEFGIWDMNIVNIDTGDQVKAKRL